MLLLQRYVERDIRSAHPPQKISKPSLFFNFFINQTFLVNIYAENTASLQNRAGRDFLMVCNPNCVPYTYKRSGICRTAGIFKRQGLFTSYVWTQQSMFVGENKPLTCRARILPNYTPYTPSPACKVSH